MKLCCTLAIALTATFGVALSARADLIGFYPFDADYNDASGFGNDGVASGDTALAPFMGVDGIGGGAAQFSGAGHVVVPIDSNPTNHTDMTVTMWVKADASIVAAPSLYKTFGHDDGGWDRTFGLDNRNGAFRWAAFTGAGITNATSTPVTDEWTFLATVWETASSSVTVYAGRDGEANATITEALINTPSGHTTSAIGNLRPDNFSEGWVGLIDNVTIHDSALFPAEIDAWKATTGPVPEPHAACLLLSGMVMMLRLRRR